MDRFERLRAGIVMLVRKPKYDRRTDLLKKMKSANSLRGVI